MYEIALGNGTIIKEVTIEGTICYTKQEITRSTFEGGLHSLTITQTSADEPKDDEEAIVSEIRPGMYYNMKLDTCCVCNFKPGYYMFEFSPIPEREMHDLTVDARLDYLEMINDM